MKKYKDINVYEATQKRLEFIFNEFDYIYLSFSGGKDSALLLNLVIDFMKRNNITKKIGLFHRDMEAQYSLTSQYIEETYKKLEQYIIPYWFCVEILHKNSFSSNNPFWVAWDRSKKDLWCRDIPNLDYIITNEKNSLPFLKDKMKHKEHYKEFGKYYSKQVGTNKVANLIGLRADESLDRYCAVSRFAGYKDIYYSTDNKYNYSFYPIYDWSVKDLWFANYKYNFDYNKIYDYFTYAGIPIEKQRVAQPFNLTAKKDIMFYKIIEPDLWNKFLKRVDGVNSNSLDGINLPSNFKNYQDYCNFLLNTLKQETKDIFIKKINNRVNNFTDKELFYKTIANSILNIDINLKYLQNINLKNDKSLKQNTINKWSNQDD